VNGQFLSEGAVSDHRDHDAPIGLITMTEMRSEGEADVLRPRGGDFEVVARVGLKQWRELAATPSPR
jgi:hypothetical protein